jgi:diguanylate cyclase (GGDEF)-like protein
VGVPDLAGWRAGKHLTSRLIVAVGTSACFAVAITPIAGLPLPPSPALFTLLMTTAVISTCFTSVLLAAQARALRSYSQAILAIGYGFTSATMIPYILCYPGVFGHLAQRLDLQKQSSFSLFLLWHLALIGSVAAYHLVGWKHPSGTPWRGGPRFIRRAQFGAFASWFVVAGIALWGLKLPLIGADMTITALGRGFGAALALLTCVPMLMPLRYRRFNRLLDVCLSTACALMAIDLYLAIVAPERYSLGWYVGRLNIVALSSTVLLMLIWQTGKMYGQLSASASRFKDEAYRDGLTGIPNRRAFDEELSRRFSKLASGGASFALAMIDIDRFKALNDTHGHLAGDACIVRVAAVLSAAIRQPKDFVARFGGEEFAVVMEDVGSGEALLLCERIRALVEDSEILETAGAVTVSIGGALAEAEDGRTQLLGRADELLYLAKSRGRNRVEFEGHSSASSRALPEPNSGR